MSKFLLSIFSSSWRAFCDKEGRQCLYVCGCIVGLTLAAEVVARLPALADFTEQTTDRDRDARVESFALRFAEVAYRRPLMSTEGQLLKGLLASTPNLEAAMRSVVLFVLQSPYFGIPSRT